MAPGTSSLVDAASDVETKLVLASGPRQAQLRIAQALAARPDLTTHTDPSIRELMSWGSGVRTLVAYCEGVSPEQLERFKELKRDVPDLLIVAVCESADRRAVRRLLDGGIDGFVFADQLEEALGPTVAAVFAGQMVVPRDLRDSVDRPSLSTRERQILAMVVMGLTNQEIGARMFLAESTVKSHLSSAYTKLGVRSRNEAVAVILDRPDSLGTGIAAVTPKVELRAA
ncbi:MAG TPA: response regulator transcription factor [Solirubrobacteraceae bacterium]|nr:response regulator transcription factor [Solirubrobacteraceae bacterium]